MRLHVGSILAAAAFVFLLLVGSNDYLYAQDQYLCSGSRCLPTQYCQLPEGVCDPEAMPDQGVCVDRPSTCDGIYEPVCGCNGHTYVNECQAAWSGVSIDFQSECPQPEYCAGQFDITCLDPSEYCYLDIDGCCCDLGGQCLDVPAQCTTTCNPVCGCNDVSYLNRCEAESAPTNVTHHGDCDEIVSVRFVAADELTWWSRPATDYYNLYRKVVIERPPQDYGQCLQEGISGNTAFVHEEPTNPGELWLLVLTGQYPEGEGSMGHITTDCSLRVPEAACGGSP
jgi:hypothetical protein